MDTLRELYKIGFGPSSSHTMGPEKAALHFLERTKDHPVDHFRVELYGSLAATGVGHLTDWIILKTLGEKRTVVDFKSEITYNFHTNGMKFFAYDENDKILDEYLIFSVGGGSILELNQQRKGAHQVYELNSMRAILNWCEQNQAPIHEYVFLREGEAIKDYLALVWQTMKTSVEEGFKSDQDILPGILKLKRRAPGFYQTYLQTNDFTTLMFASAQSVSEQNAAAGRVVTAPTCGSSGVLPGLLYSLQTIYGYRDEEIIKALATAGIVGNLVKENASISGAEAGCQAEVGTACSMAAAAMSYLSGGTIYQIEYSAEIGLEHHLGLTCDPVMGLVQVPCIERNSIAARRAFDACKYAMLTDGSHVIQLDEVIQTMKETGHDIDEKYKETSLGGLAICRLH
jgi:L-serine dehydratase